MTDGFASNFVTDKLSLSFFLCADFQFITFKDGKIGVNFFGYTAEAGW
jgi:hypothetical protein